MFYLLRSGDCPYFYLLAHHYTVLFRAAGVGGIKHLHALFTPTTKGLREAFKEEGKYGARVALSKLPFLFFCSFMKGENKHCFKVIPLLPLPCGMVNMSMIPGYRPIAYASHSPKGGS